MVLFTRANVSKAQLWTIRAGNQRINAFFAVIASARLTAAGADFDDLKPGQINGRYPGESFTRSGFIKYAQDVCR